jgi:hypothetical protein
MPCVYDQLNLVHATANPVDGKKRENNPTPWHPTPVTYASRIRADLRVIVSSTDDKYGKLYAVRRFLTGHKTYLFAICRWCPYLLPLRTRGGEPDEPSARATAVGLNPFKYFFGLRGNNPSKVFVPFFHA